MAVTLRSNYRHFHNRCANCGHRLQMHVREENENNPNLFRTICKTIYNGELPTGEDKKCGCTVIRTNA